MIFKKEEWTKLIRQRKNYVKTLFNFYIGYDITEEALGKENCQSNTLFSSIRFSQVKSATPVVQWLLQGSDGYPRDQMVLGATKGIQGLPHFFFQQCKYKSAGTQDSEVICSLFYLQALFRHLILDANLQMHQVKDSDKIAFQKMIKLMG